MPSVEAYVFCIYLSPISYLDNVVGHELMDRIIGQCLYSCIIGDKSHVGIGALKAISGLSLTEIGWVTAAFDITSLASSFFIASVISPQTLTFFYLSGLIWCAVSVATFGWSVLFYQIFLLSPCDMNFTHTKNSIDAITFTLTFLLYFYRLMKTRIFICVRGYVEVPDGTSQCPDRSKNAHAQTFVCSKNFVIIKTIFFLLSFQNLFENVFPNFSKATYVLCAFIHLFQIVKF